jgi:type III secretion protein U
MSEKTEQPTGKALEDARDKGQVAVSRDLARLVALGVMGEVAFAGEPACRAALLHLLTLPLLQIGQPFAGALGQLLASAAVLLAGVFGVCLLAVTVAAVAGNWGQFGILVAPDILTPKLDKLDPVNGLKNLVSLKKLAEVGLSLGKVLLLGLVTYVMVRAELPALVTLAGGTPSGIYLQGVQLLHALFRALGLVCAVLALIDFAVQRHFQTKSLMMSKEDIKREYRDAEGDPMVKGQRRQLAQELADSPAVEQTDGANAVVVNPTHFAVAMLYDAESTPVPLVLAKGKDEVAQAMIRRAHARHPRDSPRVAGAHAVCGRRRRPPGAARQLRRGRPCLCRGAGTGPGRPGQQHGRAGKRRRGAAR